MGVAITIGLDSPGLIPSSASFFFSSQCPDQIWGSPSLLIQWVPGIKGMMLTTHLHLVWRLRKLKLYHNSPICLHGIVLYLLYQLYWTMDEVQKPSNSMLSLKCFFLPDFTTTIFHFPMRAAPSLI
jgi:hypothetical protein